MTVATPTWERFWPKVDTSGDCWQWQAATANGYALRLLHADHGQVPA